MVYLGKTDYPQDPDDTPDSFKFTTRIESVKTHYCKVPSRDPYEDKYTQGSEGYCTECGQMWVFQEYDDGLTYGLEWAKKTKKIPGKHWWNKATYEPVKIQLGKKMSRDMSFLY